MNHQIWNPHDSNSPVLVDLAAVNGLGFSSHQTWAFWRCDVTPFQESPFVCANGERATMATLQTLPHRLFGAERMATLSVQALNQLDLEPWKAPGMRCGLYAGISDRFALDKELYLSQWKTLQTSFEQWMREHFEDATDSMNSTAPIVHLIPKGHAAFAEALLRAHQDILAQKIDVAIVGGIETYYDPLTIRLLLEKQRLFDGEDFDTLLPGEGAAFVLLTSHRHAKHHAASVYAHVEAVAVGHEEASMHTQIPCTGRGLSDTMRVATQHLKQQRRQLHWLIGDCNNEEYRTHEFGMALQRALAPGGLDTAGKDFFEIAADEFDHDFLPECFGDMGAASMPTAAVIAAEAFVRGQPAAPNCLIVGTSTTEPRGSVLICRPAQHENL